jgi:hypothetical protein
MGGLPVEGFCEGVNNKKESRMKRADKINKISEDYRKYIVQVKINGSYFNLICGDDLSDNMNEKLLIDKDNNIIISKNIGVLAKFIKKNKVFDNINLKKWLRNITPFYKKQPDYKYALYNFDVLVEDFILNIEKTLVKLPRRNCAEYIDFINLIDSFAYQTNNKVLMKLLRDRNIRTLWEYLYDNFVWKVRLNQDLRKKALRNFDMELFRITFSKIYALFLSNMRYLM